MLGAELLEPVAGEEAPPGIFSVVGEVAQGGEMEEVRDSEEVEVTLCGCGWEGVGGNLSMR